MFAPHQELLQLSHCAAAVADAVLGGGIHLREGLVVAVGEEHRVVAEAVGAALLGEDDAVHAALEEVLLAVQDQGDHGLETGPAVLHAAHLREELADVVLVGAALAGVTGGIDARLSVQCLDLQSRVVGEAVAMVVLHDVLGFLQSVAFQRVGGLRDVGAAEFGQVEDVVIRAEDSADLVGFV